MSKVGQQPRYRMKRATTIQPLDKPYRLIPLTQGQSAIVDAEDFEWLSKFNWYAAWNRYMKSFYAVRHERSHQIQLRMNREILGCRGKEQGDHKNHNTLDNRRSNLRKCTAKQNRQNCNKKRNGTSGYKGVSWNKDCHKWLAQIKTNNRNVHLGLFKHAEDAARAYDRASLLYHGEFGLRNFS